MSGAPLGESIAIDSEEHLGLLAGAQRFFHLPSGRIHHIGPSDQVPGKIGNDGFRRFATDEEAQQYGDLTWGGAYYRLPGKQMIAVDRYTECSLPHTWICRTEDPQEVLSDLERMPVVRDRVLSVYHGRWPTLSQVRETVDHVNEAASQPISEGVEFNRSLSRITFMKKYENSDPRSLVGTVQTEPAPMSVSLGSPPFDERFRLHLLAPPGQHGLWVGRESYHPEQREFILPGGTSYHFTAVSPGKSDEWHMYARLLPKGS